MKKSFFFSLALSMFGIGMLAMPALAVDVATSASFDGELIKGESYQTVYYLAEDGKRYVFPNSKTYFSWFDDFTEVREISDEELFTYPLGGNVRYKPGSLLLKITTNPKVYAVGENGKLKWVKDEAMAIALYGENWNRLIEDLPDAFYGDYEIGEDADEDFDQVVMGEEFPSISHNRGFKVKEHVQDRVQDRVERRCSILEETVNKLQKRIQLYEITVEGVGNDFVEECVDGGMRHMDKVQVCRMSDEGQYRTLEVSANALRGMLANGSRLGDCSDFSDIEDMTDDTTEQEVVELECGENEEAVENADGVEECVLITVGEEIGELDCAADEEIVVAEDGTESCEAVEEEEEEELACDDNEIMVEVEGEMECVQCDDGEEVVEGTDGEVSCQLINEGDDELECGEGEEAGEIDGEEACVPVAVE